MSYNTDAQPEVRFLVDLASVKKCFTPKYLKLFNIAFVSGHLDLTREEFNEHYRKPITEAIGRMEAIVVGDAKGCDLMTQELVFELVGQDYGLYVYHMFDNPRNNPHSFRTEDGFRSDDERDEAMTASSTYDIAWVRPGREKSGTARNLYRRRARSEVS